MEEIKLKGEVHYLGKHSDGKIFVDKTVPNTVTSAGKGVVATQMYGVGTAFSAIAIGTGTGGTTGLTAESTTNGGARRSGSNVTTSSSNAVSTWVTTYTFSGNLAITEEGIFNSTVATGGTMVAYQSFSVINVVTNDTLQITHTITLS